MILKTLDDSHVEWDGKIYRCAVGRTGFTDNKQEGDGATPRGTFRFKTLYYRPDRLEKPLTALPLISLQADDGWCDDPTDPLYNQPVKLPYPARCEQLWREDHLYDLMITTDYNQNPTLPGAGSAIFIHVARLDSQGHYQPTAGCLVLSLNDLQQITQTACADAIWVV